MIVSRFGENVFRSTSINFGFIPDWYIGHNYVDQHTAGTRHSSPLLSFPFLSGLIKAKNAKRFADEPELTIKQYLDLIKFENFFSNSFVFFAIVILDPISQGLGVGPKQLFFFVSIIVGLGLGATQSSSRAFVGMLCPPGRSAEMFGLWGMANRVAVLFSMATFGPLSDYLGSIQGACVLLLLYLGADWETKYYWSLLSRLVRQFSQGILRPNSRIALTGGFLPSL